MNIYEFKTESDRIFQPGPTHALISVEQAWAAFKASLTEPLEEDFSDELSFSFSLASQYDGNKTVIDENLFQIYFGRLIDITKSYPWRTAEINFYYRYSMNPQLRSLLADLTQQDFEVAYSTTEDPAVIQQKIDSVLAFADQNYTIWDVVRELKPALSSYHFWIK